MVVQKFKCKNRVIIKSKIHKASDGLLFKIIYPVGFKSHQKCDEKEEFILPFLYWIFSGLFFHDQDICLHRFLLHRK